MTIEEYMKRLKELVAEAYQAGLDPEEICAISESVLEENWENNSK